MLAQKARLTDGEADVQIHKKAKTSYLGTFADGDEIAEQWTMLTKSGDGRDKHTMLLSHLLPSFPRTYCSLPSEKSY